MTRTALDRLGLAIAAGVPARIVYEDADGCRTIRGIRVLDMDDASGVLRCECDKRRAPRSFRIDRVAHVFPA